MSEEKNLVVVAFEAIQAEAKVNGHELLPQVDLTAECSRCGAVVTLVAAALAAALPNSEYPRSSFPTICEPKP